MRLVALILALSPIAWADGNYFQRPCSVQQAPSPNATAVCRVRAGTPIQALERSAVPGYFVVALAGCKGYISDSCVQLPTAGQAAGARSLAHEESLSEKVSIALQGAFDFSRATVDYDTTWSKGIGFGGGVQVNIPIGMFRLSPGVVYEQLQIRRTIDGSGAIENPDPTPVTQSLGYVGAQLLAGMRMDSVVPLGDPVFWWELGGEYLHPISGSQSIRDAASESFTNTDKVFLALLGMSADLPLSETLLLAGRLQLYYNLFGTQESRYFGARFSVALGLTL